MVMDGRGGGWGGEESIAILKEDKVFFVWKNSPLDIPGR